VRDIPIYLNRCVNVMFIHRNQILVLPTYAGNVSSLPLVVIIGYGTPGKGMMKETKSIYGYKFSRLRLNVQILICNTK